MENNNELKAKKNDNVNFVSFSEVDKDGVFREAYGYFENIEDKFKENEKQNNENKLNSVFSEKYLPIGSIVLLKNAQKRIMVIGFVAKGKTLDDRIFDYMGCLYPEGVLSSEEILLFDHNQIDKIYYMGYVDEEWKKYQIKVKDSASKLEESHIAKDLEKSSLAIKEDSFMNNKE